MKKPTKPLKPQELENMFVLFQSNVWPSMVDCLAEELNVSTNSIRRLGVGYDLIEECWIFAERDDQGQIVGLSRRNRDGSKFMIPGSKRGLVYECTGKVEKGRPSYAGSFVPIYKLPGVDCPLCGKSDWCMVSSDYANGPSAVICPRTKAGSIKDLGNGNYLHRLRNDQQEGGSVSSVLPGSDKPYIVVEGASDVLAAMDLGYVGIGRPSAESGSQLVASLLRNKNAVIMGENDAGAGIRGMDRCFTQCKARLKEVSKCLPPAAYKDLRKWKPTAEEFESWLKQNCEKSDTSKLIHGVLDYVDLADKFIVGHKYSAGSGKRLVFHQGGWYHYKNGYYIPIDPLVLESQIAKAFHGYEYLDDVTEKVKPLSVNIRLNREILAAVRNEVITMVPNDVLEPCIISSGKPFDSSHIIFFKNGMLDVMTGKLLDHTDNIFTTAALPYEYDPKARYDHWLSTAHQWLQEDDDRIALLQEWMGYNMTTSNYLEQLMFIYGPSGSGKSTAIRIMQDILGGNYMPTTVDQLTRDQFGLASLVGKYACIISEEDTVSASQQRRLLTIMKKITGNDAVPIRRMRQEAVSGNLFCKISYISNSLPVFHDETQSIFRRYNLLNFNETFKHKPNVTLYQELKQERQGIAVWAVEGLRRLLNNGGKFTRPGIAEAEINELKEESSPIRHMLMNWCAFGPDLMVPLQELYTLYEAICNEEHVRNPVGYRKFKRRILEALDQSDAIEEIRIETARGLRGLTITESAKKRYLEG